VHKLKSSATLKIEIIPSFTNPQAIGVYDFLLSELYLKKRKKERKRNPGSSQLCNGNE